MKAKHSNDLDFYHNLIINSLIKSASSINPTVNINRNKNKGPAIPKRIVGWSEHVKPLQQIMLTKLSLWRDSGSTINSSFYSEYSKARKDYHTAIRKVRQNEKQLKAEKVACSLTKSSSPKEFWANLKCFFPSKSSKPDFVEGS